MALLHNTVIQSAMLGRRMTGLEPQLPRSGLVRAERFNWYAGDHNPSRLSGYADGCLPPATWMMPRKSGGMASRGFVGGSGAIAPNLLSVLEGLATITGSGSITAAGGLIVNLLATMTGSGGISSADVKAFLNLLATIGGSGGVTAASSLSGLGALVATLIGSGGAIGSTATGTGQLSATLRGYGDLTPEGIRDAVWNALAASFNTSGTMGNKLNSAASGGVDYAALGQAVWAVLVGDADNPGSIGAALQASGATPPTPAENATAVRSELAAELLRVIEIAKIHGLVQGVDLVVTPSSRVAGDVAQTISGDGTTSSTVSRA